MITLNIQWTGDDYEEGQKMIQDEYEEDEYIYMKYLIQYQHKVKI